MDTKGRHVPKEVILTCVRWYLCYRVSLRDIEALIAGRGIDVDPTTVHRWIVKYG